MPTTLSLLFTHKNPREFISTASRRPSIVCTPKAKPARPSSSIVWSTPISAADPNIIGVFEQCIRYAKGFPDVWFATKGEIAKYYLDHYVDPILRRGNSWQQLKSAKAI